jgi:hypothetical protein
MAHPDTSHSVSHTRPRPPCGSLPFHNLPCKRTHLYPVTLLLIGLSYFQAKPSLTCIPQLFSNLVIIYLDFKLSPCLEYSMSSFKWFPGVWFIIADVSEHSICSIFLGRRFEVPTLWSAPFLPPTFRLVTVSRVQQVSRINTPSLNLQHHFEPSA